MELIRASLLAKGGFVFGGRRCGDRGLFERMPKRMNRLAFGSHDCQNFGLNTVELSSVTFASLG